MNRLFTMVFVILFLTTARAEIKIPSFFSSKMVLQQKSLIRIWGTGNSGEQVWVNPSWDGKKYRTVTDANGKWSVFIGTPQAGGPFFIKIKGKNQIVLQDVLIGEVWLCSGQSNMDMPVKGYMNSPVEHSNDILMESENPSIRLFHVSRQYSSSPLADLKGEWQYADLSSVRDFSAVGYQFAALLEKSLKVPVGIIQATWGGSPIEAWMDSSSVKKVLGDRLKEDAAISKAVHQTPSSLYNAMIAPLSGFAMAGVLWYQGEQNRHNYQSYGALLPALVKAWRNQWNTGTWPFYYVQIAPMSYPEAQKPLVPRLREVQLKAVDQIGKSGMVVSIDAGEEHNIHPANKTVISRRLAYLALADTYGKAGLVCRSPEYRSVHVSGDTVKVKFSNAEDGLSTFGKALSQFELAGADRIFFPAKAEIRNNEVWVRTDKVRTPVAVRYAFKDWAFGELYNTAGLPASSFRSDDW